MNYQIASDANENSKYPIINIMLNSAQRKKSKKSLASKIIYSFYEEYQRLRELSFFDKLYLLWLW